MTPESFSPSRLRELYGALRAEVEPRPLCRDCADRDGTCYDGRPCNPYTSLRNVAEQINAAFPAILALADRLQEADAVIVGYCRPDSKAKSIQEAFARHASRARERREG